MITKIINNLLLMALSFSFAFAIVVDTQASTLQQIKRNGVLRVGLNKGFPPFAMQTKGGRWIGIDVDLANELAKNLGVKAKFFTPPFKQLIKDLNKNKIDIIIAGMTITLDRALKVNFTEPYFETGQGVLFNNLKLAKYNIFTQKDLARIKKLTIAVKQHTVCELQAKKHFTNATVITYKTRVDAANAVYTGKVDAMVHDMPFIDLWRIINLDKTIKLSTISKPFTVDDYGMAIRKGDQEFLNWLNLFVYQIKKRGKMDNLKNYYFKSNDWLKIIDRKQIL